MLELLKEVGVTGLLVAVATAVSIKILSWRMDARLHQRNTTFTKLHEKRIEAIEVIHAALIDLRVILGRFASPVGHGLEQERTDTATEFFDMLATFNDKPAKKAIWLSAGLEEQVNAARIEMMQIAARFQARRNQDIQSGRQHISNETFEAWADANEQLKANVESMLRDVRDEFKRVLGVASSDSNKRLN